MGAQIIDGKALAEKIRGEIKSEISSLKEKHGRVPLLAAVQVGENPASAVYIKNQKKSCEEAGIEYKLHQLPADTTEEKLIEFIKKNYPEGLPKVRAEIRDSTKEGAKLLASE